MQVGEPFNPYKLFVGAYIPRALMETQLVSANAKLVWAKLAQLSHGNDYVEATHEDIALGVGITERSVCTPLNELCRHRFIGKEQPTGADRLKHKPVRYYFIWHELMESALRSTAQPRVRSRAQSEVRSRAQSEVRSRAQSIHEESTHTESTHTESNTENTRTPLPPTGGEPMPVPFQEIIGAYNRAVSGTCLTQVKAVSVSRKAHLSARWQEPLFRENYARIFELVASSSFLSGRVASPTHPNFRADFDWLTKNDTNYAKVLEGKYSDAVPQKPVDRDKEIAVIRKQADIKQMRGEIRRGIVSQDMGDKAIAAVEKEIQDILNS